MSGLFGTTAGPWTTQSRVGEGYVHEDTPWATNPVRRNAICQVASVSRSSDEFSANVRAIAQVPAMLALVKAVAESDMTYGFAARAIARELEGK